MELAYLDDDWVRFVAKELFHIRKTFTRALAYGSKTGFLDELLLNLLVPTILNMRAVAEQTKLLRQSVSQVDTGFTSAYTCHNIQTVLSSLLDQKSFRLVQCRLFVQFHFVSEFTLARHRNVLFHTLGKTGGPEANELEASSLGFKSNTAPCRVRSYNHHSWCESVSFSNRINVRIRSWGHGFCEE